MSNKYIDLTPVIYDQVKMYNLGNRRAFTSQGIVGSLYKTAKRNKIQGDGIFDWIKQGYGAIYRFLKGPRLGFSPKVVYFNNFH